MKNYIYILLSAIIINILATSCEDVIDVDLNDTDPKLVVEAILYKDSTIVVKLTQTTSYFNSETPVTVNDAEIILSTGNFNDTLTFTDSGNYHGNTIVGTEDTEYTLTINRSGETFIANTFLPKQTEIYSFEATESDFFEGFGSLVDLEFKMKDEAGQEDFFMVRFFENGEYLKNEYILIPDILASKDTITVTSIWMFEEDESEVVIQVFSIDEPIYDYFYQLSDITGGGMSSNPYNPTSNFSNGALGYFAAWSYVSDTTITPVFED